MNGQMKHPHFLFYEEKNETAAHKQNKHHFQIGARWVIVILQSRHPMTAYDSEVLITSRSFCAPWLPFCADEHLSQLYFTQYNPKFLK